MEQQWNMVASDASIDRNMVKAEERKVQKPAETVMQILQAGIAAAQNGDVDKARNLLTTVVGRDGRNEAAWLWLASLSDQPTDRMALIQKVLEINPANERALEWASATEASYVKTLLEDGIKSAKAGRRAAATHVFLQATDRQPENETAWLWLASLAESPEDQLAYLQRVININPNNARATELFAVANTNLARKLLQTGFDAATAGNRAQAREILEDVLEFDPNLEDAWLLKAYTSDSDEEKIASFEKVLELNPSNQRAQSELSALSQRAAFFGIAWCCPLCLTRAEKQVDQCEACGAKLTLEDVDGLLANSKVNQDRVRAAIERLHQRLPVDDSANYHLGLAYLNLGDIKQAIKFLGTALEFDTHDDVLRARLDNLVQRQSEMESKTAEANVPVQKHGRVVMVVDDSPTVRKLVKIKLERHGYSVVSAVDGMDALAKMNEAAPDLMLVDVTMPRLDGYQLCKLVKGNEATRHIPVLMLSGKDGFFDKLRGRMAGSVAYLTKPFEPEALLQAVDEHCMVKRA